LIGQEQLWVYTDYFTFLNLKLNLSFGYGTIEPVADFDKVPKSTGKNQSIKGGGTAE